MPLVTMKDMLKHAYENCYAVAAFDLVCLASLRGVLQAAEKQQAPIILNLAEPHFEWLDFELLMPAVEVAAKRAAIPVAMHFDQGSNYKNTVKAINLGCNSVMLHSSDTPLDKNIDITRKVATMAHSCGITVAGNLNCAAIAKAEDVETYVQNTSIDFLTISFSTAHSCKQGTPDLYFKQLLQINKKVKIPLAIHNKIGFDNRQIEKLITMGVSKVNHSLSLSYTERIEHIANKAIQQIVLCGSNGRAKEVLAYCKPWKSVEHLIIYNVQSLSRADTKEMIAKGYKILSAIPGVRKIFVGEALKEENEYQYTWLVHFCHPAVIDSYRDHPDHVAFANQLFRPVAAKRISIDYLELL